MGSWKRDFLYSVRMLAKRPGFTAAALAVLALGIGANTAVFSLVNAFLLKPLILRQPEQLVGLYSRDITTPDSYRAFSYPNYVDIRDANAVFSDLAAHNMAMVGVSEGDTTRRVFADIVSSNFFQTLGVPIFRGRGFTVEEERSPGGDAVVIASYPFWQKLGSPQDLSNLKVRVNGRPYQLIGVAPRGFTGTTAMISPGLYFPLGAYESVFNDFDGQVRPLSARDNPCLIAIGRMRPGIHREAADAQLAPVAAAMAQAHPAENKDQALIVRQLSRLGVSTNPTNDSMMTVPAGLLLAMAAVVLLIAALNVANMTLARGLARRREIAIRLAVGGGRRSIVQQLFIEALVLALAGGAAGLLLSYAGTTALVGTLTHIAPLDMVFDAAPDARVLGATMGFCLFATLLFGFWPAWNLSRPNLTNDLRGGSDAELFHGKPRRLFSRRNILVVAQISLSLMLLTAAGLFVRNSARAANVETGFRMQNGVAVELDASLAGYNEQQGRRLYSAVLDRLRALPGVESASLAATVPFGMISQGRGIRAPEASGKQALGSTSNIVGGEYFRTLGIPLLRGRGFRDSESAGHGVAILDQVAATKLWPNGDAVGRMLLLMPERIGGHPQELEVVGVVGSVRDHILGPQGQPHVYLPFSQQYQSDMHVHLKLAPTDASGEKRMMAAVREEIRAIDARLPVLGVQTLRQLLESSAETWIVATGARMFAISGVIALLLAVIGLYGVRAYSVARRTREIGIRMALGAGAAETQKLILREGLSVTALGTGIGLVLSLLAGKALAVLLTEVSGVDPVVFSAAALLLTGVSIVACYVPARRAARIDPMVALRCD